MHLITFSLKRTLRRPVFLLLLILCAVSIWLTSLETAVGTYPPAGVVNLSSAPQAQRVVAHLTDNGFVLYEDEALMRTHIENGRLDCGAILPADLSQRLERLDTDGFVHLIVSPASYTPELYQNHLAAAIFREYAPYLTAPLFDSTDVTPDEVRAEYETMFSNGYAFSFDVTTLDESVSPTGQRSLALVMGAVSILLFILLFPACSDFLDASFREMPSRLGLMRAFTHIMLPGMFMRLLCVLFSAVLGLLAAGLPELILPMTIYAILLTILSILITAVLPGTRVLYVLTPVLLVASLALCPIFSDLALFSPVVAAIRYLLPPYWFWLIAANPLYGALLIPPAFLLALALLLLRYTRIQKYRLRHICIP